MYKLIDYDFKLPEELISHAPEKERETSRLLHIERQNNAINHKKFSDIIDLLKPSDVLVINNTKVIPARLNGFKETGGKVEVLIIDYIGGMEKLTKTSQFECECLIKSSKRPKDNSILTFGDELTATVLSFKDGIYLVAENINYNPVKINNEMEFEVWGDGCCHWTVWRFLYQGHGSGNGVPRRRSRC